MALVLIVALLIGGGTTFAAEGALPGGPLYAVKVSINEQVQSALAFSSEAQAKLDAELAARRLSEAETLASRGELSAEVQADIEKRFEAHAESFEKESAKLASEKKNGALLEVRSYFEGKLRAHQNVLTKLAVEGQADASAEVTLMMESALTAPAASKISVESSGEARTDLRAILQGVETRLGVIAEKRSAAEAEVRGTEDVKIKATAEEKMETAQELLLKTSERLKEKRSIKGFASVEIVAAITASTEAIAQGKVQFENGKSGDALINFEKAIRILEEVNVRIENSSALEAETSMSTEGGVSQGGGGVSEIKIESLPVIENSGEIKEKGRIELNLGL